MTRLIGEPSDKRDISNHDYRVRQLERRPALSAAGGNAIYAIKIFDDDETVTSGDGKFEWEIPEDLDGALLLKLEAFVTTASSSGGLLIQVANERAAGGTVDMLSTRVGIDANELNSKDAGTQPVVDTANDDVAWGDHLRIDVDSAGTGAKGLGITLFFISLLAYQFAMQGTKGDPGGVTEWTGEWTTSTNYLESQAVSHNGTSYVARVDHTSGASSEPGVGASWETYWMVLAASSMPQGADGWTSESATWTYASATTFTISGDVTAQFSKGTRIKLTQSSTVKYFVVTASSYSSPNTTVTITGGSDYTLANAAISATYYSYEANPQGYPGWFNYTPTYGGFSSDPPSTTARFSVVDRQCSLILVTGNGTSNAANFDVTLPIAVITTFQVPCRVVDNGTNQTVVGKFNLNGGTVSSTVNKDMANAGFTTSGSKACTVAVTYDI